MRLNDVVIVHRGQMLGEALSTALSTFPAIRPVAVATSAIEVRALTRRIDAVALDAGVPGAAALAVELRKRGSRVVFLGYCADQADATMVPVNAAVADLAEALVPAVATMRAARPAEHRLTRREREILDLVARGLAAKQVASQLGISPKTVEQHKTRIFSKLGVRNQTAAVSLLLGGPERSPLLASASGTPAA